MKKVILLPIFIALLSFSSIGSAQEKFEYKLIHIEIGKGTAYVEQELNAKGKDGWEIANVYVQGMIFTVFMKRKLK